MGVRRATLAPLAGALAIACANAVALASPTGWAGGRSGRVRVRDRPENRAPHRRVAFMPFRVRSPHGWVYGVPPEDIRSGPSRRMRDVAAERCERAENRLQRPSRLAPSPRDPRHEIAAGFRPAPVRSFSALMVSRASSIVRRTTRCSATLARAGARRGWHRWGGECECAARQTLELRRSTNRAKKDRTGAGRKP